MRLNLTEMDPEEWKTTVAEVVRHFREIQHLMPAGVHVVIVTTADSIAGKRVDIQSTAHEFDTEEFLFKAQAILKVLRTPDYELDSLGKQLDQTKPKK